MQNSANNLKITDLSLLSSTLLFQLTNGAAESLNRPRRGWKTLSRFKVGDDPLTATHAERFLHIFSAVWSLRVMFIHLLPSLILQLNTNLLCLSTPHQHSAWALAFQHTSGFPRARCHLQFIHYKKITTMSDLWFLGNQHISCHLLSQHPVPLSLRLSWVSFQPS